MLQIQMLLQFIILPFFTISLSLFSSASSSNFKALVSPITKDPLTSLYTLALNSNTSYVIDITGTLLWSSHCSEDHPLIPCHSHICHRAHSFPSPLCPSITNINYKHPCTCTASSINPITQTCAFGDLTYTNFAIPTTDGHTVTGPVLVRSFVSSCAPKTLLRSLPAGATGMAGLGRSKFALPLQLTTNLQLERQFAICLPSTSTAPGVAFFGSGPFFLLPPPGQDITGILSHTPLIKNPTCPDYYIDVKAIAVGGEVLCFLARVLTFDILGHGGVKLSTMTPYTTLKRHIYWPFLKAFANATKGIPRAPKVKPFDLCLNTSTLASTRLGLNVPQIDLMLANGKNWTIFGSNLMKQMGDDVACLAVVDGGGKAEQAVVIGSYQLEDNFLLFDLDKKMLGFSSTLLSFQTTCSNFNFKY